MDSSLFTPRNQLISYGLGILFITFVVCLVAFVPRAHFWAFSLLFGGSFTIYLVINQLQLSLSSVYYWLIVALLVRFVLLFIFPNLSDDVYRFIWDGHLVASGHNPFHFLPTAINDGQLAVPGLSPALFAMLNSPEYYTIYPPIAQFTFWWSVVLAPESWYWNAFWMKTWLFAFEVGNIWLMLKILNYLKQPVQSVLWYAVNPLIIIEIVGNLHFEGAMIFFFLLGYWLLLRGKHHYSAAAMALAIGSKLLPLLFMPLLIRRLGWWTSIRYFFIMGLLLLVLFSPLLNLTFIENFSQSLDLYFRKFEFNGSIYYLMRWWGYQTKGYNLIQWIGPRLGLLVLLAILVKSIFERQPGWHNFPESALFAMTIYLFLGTTIHPWYVSLPLACCVFTRYRFPVVWSGMIMLTYINYSYPEYQENLAIVAIEYIVVYSYLGLEYFGWLPAGKWSV